MSATTIEARPHFLFEARHEQFRQTLREFVGREVNPQADLWEHQERVPKALFLRGGELGLRARRGGIAMGNLQNS
jgi:acyl-CoA dehydrogenase